MSQRDSGYERKERDLYETPEWVTEALLPHLPDRDLEIWEPACASGKMVRVLARRHRVIGTDISETPSVDFLTVAEPPHGSHDAIVTNPPYEWAEEFIQRGLQFAFPRRGLVAMLLRTDYDHAKTRSYLFGGSPTFAKKVVLTKRIKWFENSKGQPSFNHAWFIWDHKWQNAPPTLAYAP